MTAACPREPLGHASEFPALGGAPQLLVEWHEGQLKRLQGVVVRDDVVAILEHLQQVACQRDIAGEPLGDDRVDAHEPDRDVDLRAAWAPGLRPQPLPELDTGSGPASPSCA